jgi:hypothetical protein
MRTAFFWLLLTVGCSTVAAGQELRPDAQKSQQNAKAAGRQTGRRQLPGVNQLHGRSVLPKASHPLPLPKNETHHATLNTAQARSAGVAQSAKNTASAGLRDTHAPSNVRPVQLHTASRPAQLPNNVRRRSPNPAILGGSASPSATSTGAISGTHVSRRP